MQRLSSLIHPPQPFTLVWPSMARTYSAALHPHGTSDRLGVHVVESRAKDV